MESLIRERSEKKNIGNQTTAPVWFIFLEMGGHFNLEGTRLSSLSVVPPQVINPAQLMTAQQQPLVVSPFTCTGILLVKRPFWQGFVISKRKKRKKNCSIWGASRIVWRLSDAFKKLRSPLITHLHCVALFSFHLVASAARPFSCGQMGNKRLTHGDISHLWLLYNQAQKQTNSPKSRAY